MATFAERLHEIQRRTADTVKRCHPDDVATYQEVLATPYDTGRGRMFHAIARRQLGLPPESGDELYKTDQDRPDTYEPESH